jgi:hypothetical protein
MVDDTGNKTHVELRDTVVEGNLVIVNDIEPTDPRLRATVFAAALLIGVGTHVLSALIGSGSLKDFTQGLLEGIGTEIIGAALLYLVVERTIIERLSKKKYNLADDINLPSE